MRILHLSPPHSLPTPACLQNGAIRTTAAHPKPIAHRPCRSEKQNTMPLVHLDGHDIAYTRPHTPISGARRDFVVVIPPCFVPPCAPRLHTRGGVAFLAYRHKRPCAPSLSFFCVLGGAALDCNLAAYHRVRVVVVKRHIADVVVEHAGCLVESQGGVLAWGAG